MKTFLNLCLGAAFGCVIGVMIGSSGHPEKLPVESSRRPAPKNSAVAVYALSQAEFRKDRRFSDILWTVAVGHMLGPEADDLIERGIRNVRQGFEDGVVDTQIRVPRE
jgi:hypothetical protein